MNLLHNESVHRIANAPGELCVRLHKRKIIMTFSNCFRLSAKMVLLISLCFSLLSHKYTQNAYASQSDEQKKLTKTEYFGDYSKATKKKTTGKVSLVVWEPHIQKLQNAGFTAVIPRTRKLTINCDEIWETKYTELLTKEEIKKYWNDLDILRLYWKDGKIQAAVVLKKYISNPITNEQFSKAEYRITYLHSRDEILEKAK